MKKLICLALSAVMLLLATACGHEHTFADATCTEPKTCTECGETEGEAKGHTFAEATCTEAKKCTVCGATEGEPAGHNFKEATCTDAKKCTVCGATEGEALGHSVSIGKCSRCNEIVGKEDYDKLMAIFETANSYNAKATDASEESDAYINSYDLVNAYYCFCDIADYHQYMQSELSDALPILNKYSELSNLKSKVQSIVNYNVRKPSSSSAQDLIDFLEETKVFSELVVDYLEATKNWVGSAILGI
ncbi:MAG: hypothetical protein KIG32_09625, partial [Ruminiclostridium sp.]|nr:hypothetical protein [Ruminiclostridium sp.]